VKEEKVQVFKLTTSVEAVIILVPCIICITQKALEATGKKKFV